MNKKQCKNNQKDFLEQERRALAVLIESFNQRANQTGVPPFAASGVKVKSTIESELERLNARVWNVDDYNSAIHFALNREWMIDMPCLPRLKDAKRETYFGKPTIPYRFYRGHWFIHLNLKRNNQRTFFWKFEIERNPESSLKSNLDILNEFYWYVIDTTTEWSYEPFIGKWAVLYAESCGWEEEEKGKIKRPGIFGKNRKTEIVWPILKRGKWRISMSIDPDDSDRMIFVPASKHRRSWFTDRVF